VNLHSLRFKLIWTHGAAIGLLAIFIGLTRYQLISYRSQRNFDDALLSDAKFFVSRIKLGRAGFDWSLDDLNLSDSLIISKLEPFFVVTDLNGNVIGRNAYGKYMQNMLSRGDLKNVLRQKTGFSKMRAADGAAYRFVSLQSSVGAFPEPAIIHVGKSLDSLESLLEEHRILYIYSVPLLLAISCIVGWFLAGTSLRPFEEVTRIAEKITSENLNTQIVSNRKEEEVQRLVYSFNSMVMRLNESFQQMRKFNADVAHELRTPLAILQGETEVALRTPNLPEEIQSVLVSNMEELDRLTRLVNNMLTLAEADAGRHVLMKEPVNLKALLQDLIEQMRLLAIDRNIQIDLMGDAELWIDADQLWLRRALVNLLDNAIKYSKNGGKIDVSVELDHSTARLKIKDNGIGISSEDMPRIFDRLYRADPARTRVGGGSGLGLSLVKWIIEAHKGSIRVASLSDIGSTFEIILPAKFGMAEKP
jgi:two-component system, OmpR family, sensor kinase